MTVTGILYSWRIVVNKFPAWTSRVRSMARVYGSCFRPDIHQEDLSIVFEKILVANRGEIALRVIRACQELEIPAVAVYSDADAEALHVRHADESVNIGPPPAGKSYLKVEALLEAAKETGAEAVHPWLRFPGRERLIRGGLPGRGPDVHRSVGGGHRKDG